MLPYGDVSNISYDAAQHRYIATTKQRTLNIAPTPGTIDRMAWVSTSTDFETWTTPKLAVEGDLRDDGTARAQGGLEAQIYGMPVYPYESTYIGLPWMYDVDNYTEGVYAPAGDGPIVPELASSRDLNRWSRPARRACAAVGRGRRVGRFHDFHLDHDAGVRRHGVDLLRWLQRGPWWRSRSARLDRAGDLAADGFVSVHNSGDDDGTLVTKPITFTGTTLRLNATVAAGGSLKVEVLNSAGTPITGFTAADSVPITGDQLTATVAWSSGASLSTLAGQSVKLKFYLDNVDLYSYWL